METISILTFSTPKYKVRVWRSKPYESTGFTDLQVFVMRLQDSLELPKLAEELCKHDSVIEVEVLDWDNNGVRCSK
jgi:hypothetical protein